MIPSILRRDFYFQTFPITHSLW